MRSVTSAVRWLVRRTLASVRRGVDLVRGSGSAASAHTAAPSESSSALAGPTDLERAGRSPEEYVLYLLSERGGRIRQQTVAEVSGWSEATVSRLLSQMEDRDALTRVKVGREKVVCLPDQDANP